MGKGKGRPERENYTSRDLLLSPQEVSQLAKVDPSRVRAWRIYGAPWGKLRAVKIGTRHAYRKGDVQDFLDAREKHLASLEAGGRRLPPHVRKPPE